MRTKTVETQNYRPLKSGEELSWLDEIWWGGQWRKVSFDEYSRAYVPNVIGLHYRRVDYPYER